MKIKSIVVFAALIFMGLVNRGSVLPDGRAEGVPEDGRRRVPIGMAVEFTDHAAAAYVARAKGWYEEEGLELKTYDSYITGMALAAAMSRGDLDAAYICLVPAVNIFANARVPIKIVAGTHKYGYGLVVDPGKVRSVRDLEKPGIRIGCVREGGAVDILFQRIIEKYGLDKDRVISRTLRMNPPQMVLAVKSGQLDAAFLPEHHATVAESAGLRMLLTGRDVWPEMQGSVLIVKEKLLKNQPETVEKLVRVSRKATSWINDHPEEAADITAAALRNFKEDIFPVKTAVLAGRIKLTPEIIERSMARLDFTSGIDPEEIQKTIDYLAKLKYIKAGFEAEKILDLRFLD